MNRALAVPVALLAAVGAHARTEELALHHVALDLPGPPAKVLPLDVDRDGREDLVIVVAFSEIEEIGEDRFENLVQFTRVIPALFDRREIRLYVATEDAGYRQAAAAELPFSVLNLEVGPADSLVALTDEGLATVRFEPSDAGWAVHIEARIADPPVLALTKAFYSSLDLVHDLNGDGILDVLLPSDRGLAVHLGSATGVERERADFVELAGSERPSQSSVVRVHPIPEVRDLDGDGVADLYFGSALENSPATAHVLLGSREGRFRPLRREPLDCHDRGTDLRFAIDPSLAPWPTRLGAVRDLDGASRAEVVTVEERPRGDSMRKELKDAKRPKHLYRFHRLREDMSIELEPYQTLEVVGHAMGENDGSIPEDDGSGQGDPSIFLEQFVDLDDDGRSDLVTITLDFSMLQALRVLMTKKISIGIEFHVWAQGRDETFRKVEGLDLSEKLKFDLNDLKLGRFAHFAGDFDGDGKRDFVHLGRGKTITVHRGQPGCRYPKNPDLSIPLEEEPASLDLVHIQDLDGDDRADIRVTRPLPQTDPDIAPPVRLDLYLSGGAR